MTELERVDAWWRAANYLSAAQLYLLDNPLLKEPLTKDMIKKKIVGHWGTVPGQNFVYTHLFHFCLKNSCQRSVMTSTFSSITASMSDSSCFLKP